MANEWVGEWTGKQYTEDVHKSKKINTKIKMEKTPTQLMSNMKGKKCYFSKEISKAKLGTYAELAHEASY